LASHKANRLKQFYDSVQPELQENQKHLQNQAIGLQRPQIKHRFSRHPKPALNFTIPALEPLLSLPHKRVSLHQHRLPLQRAREKLRIRGDHHLQKREEILKPRLNRQTLAEKDQFLG